MIKIKVENWMNQRERERRGRKEVVTWKLKEGK